MKLSYNEQERILQTFPRIELSYEKKISKKILSTNIFITIPKGPKYFIWFRNYKQHPVCFLLKLYRRRIQEIIISKCCFNSKLCTGIGTILYGTIFNMKNINIFNTEDIFYFKGSNLSRYYQSKKFQTLLYIFKKYIKQVAFFKNDIILGLPIIETNYNKMIQKVIELPYNLYCIQQRYLNKHSIFYNLIIKIKKEAIFLIKPKIEDDIYELYHSKQGKLEFYDFAFIRDFKTSVFMNSLFRNIKENINLDFLEESDDEEEFQNISPDKYVDLDKSFKIKCVYNERHKKWVPQQLAPPQAIIYSAEKK